MMGPRRARETILDYIDRTCKVKIVPTVGLIALVEDIKLHTTYASSKLYYRSTALRVQAKIRIKIVDGNKKFGFLSISTIKR